MQRPLDLAKLRAAAVSENLGISQMNDSNVFMQCNKDAGGLLVKVEVPDRKLVCLSARKKYDTDTSQFFHLLQTFGTSKGFVDLITK